MRAVIQRVKESKVTVNNEIVGSINKGILIYLGIGKDDTIKDIEYMIEKIINLRIFEDKENYLNLSIKDINGEILVISQFTLYGDCRHGRRPSFTDAMAPREAQNMYNLFIEGLIKKGLIVSQGIFKAKMEVESINLGPVTILLDSRKMF